MSAGFDLGLMAAPRPRPRLVSLLIATLPISQHLAVIALFLAVFYAMLQGHLGAGEVGWSCAAVGVIAHVLWRVGWGTTQTTQVGRECKPVHCLQ